MTSQRFRRCTSINALKEVADLGRVHGRTALALEGPGEVVHALHGSVALLPGTAKHPAVGEEKHLVRGVLLPVDDDTKFLLGVVPEIPLIGVKGDLDVRLTAVLSLVELSLGCL